MIKILRTRFYRNVPRSLSVKNLNFSKNNSYYRQKSSSSKSNKTFAKKPYFVFGAALVSTNTIEISKNEEIIKVESENVEKEETESTQTASSSLKYLADVIDSLFAKVCSIILSLPLFLTDAASEDIEKFIGFVEFLLTEMKDFIFEGQSLGKRILNLRIIRTDAKPLTQKDLMIMQGPAFLPKFYFRAKEFTDEEKDYRNSFYQYFASLIFDFIVDIAVMSSREDHKTTSELYDVIE